MKLYYSPGSCSLASHIVAREGALPIQLERVQLKTKQTAGGLNFLAINPKGYVPALALDDGSVLTESAAVLQFLADRSLSAPLIPAQGTLERYRAVEWIHFISTELHKGWNPLFDRAIVADAKQRYRDKIAQRLDFVADHLAHHQYLLGQAFSAPDAYLFTVLRWER